MQESQHLRLANSKTLACKKTSSMTRPQGVNELSVRCEPISSNLAAIQEYMFMSRDQLESSGLGIEHNTSVSTHR